MSVNALIFTELMDVDGFTPSRASGAYRIASEIRKAGYSCQVVDFFTKFTFEEIHRILRHFVGADTLIVGFSSTFFRYIDDKYQKFQLDQINDNETRLFEKVYTKKQTSLITINYPYHYERMRGLFQLIREINPKVKIVFGGTKSQYLSAVGDAYIIDYGDKAIIEYMKYLQGKNPFFQFESLPYNQIAIYGNKYNENFNFVESTIDWHKTDYIKKGETLPIEISRGCIFKCKFCSFALKGKKKLDYIKNESVLRDELLRNYYEFGVTRYLYCDDTHNDSIEKLTMMHKIVQSLPFELEYAAYLRHDLIYAHKETAVLLRESGLRSAFFGIETLNHDSAKAIGKGLHPEKTKELLYWLKEDVWKNEVATFSGFIIGLPHETPETIKHWAEWLFDLNCPLDLFNFQPLSIAVSQKKSRIWRSDFEIDPKKYGYDVNEKGFWRNEYFTKQTAHELAQQLSKKSSEVSQRKRIGGFNLIFMSNLGYSPRDLIGRPLSDLDYNDIDLKKSQFIENYKQNLLSFLKTST